MSLSVFTGPVQAFPFLRYFCMSSQYPFHKIPHFLRRALLHLAGSVYVGAQCETRVVVAKHVGHRFHIHTVLQSNGRECSLGSSKIKRRK